MTLKAPSENRIDHASRAHSRDSSRSENKEDADRFLAITKIDKELIDMLRLIEITLKRNFEEWCDTCEQYKNDKHFNKFRQDKYRLLDSIRSNARTLANKKREEEIVEKRKIRNIEKLKAKERTLAEPSKRQMTRSPPADLIKVVKKIIVDKEKIA